MEEIASNLGISKKTLYKHFSNKDHILKEIIANHKCEIQTFIDELVNDNSLQFIDKLEKLMNFLTQHAPIVDGPMLQDLIKNHPELWNDIKEFRKTKSNFQFSRLIKDGIDTGFFRNDIHQDFIVVAYMSAVHGLLNPEAISNSPYTIDQIHKHLSRVLLEGILSESGREKYKQLKIKKDNKGDANV
jgi:AcrR family transcriptional regulator